MHSDGGGKRRLPNRALKARDLIVRDGRNPPRPGIFPRTRMLICDPKVKPHDSCAHARDTRTSTRHGDAAPVPSPSQLWEAHGIKAIAEARLASV